MWNFAKFGWWTKEIAVVPISRGCWKAFKCWSLRKVKRSTFERTLKENEKDEKRMTKVETLGLTPI